MRAAVLTVSDASARGERPDSSGPALRKAIEERLGAEIAAAEVVPDEPERISAVLQTWCVEGIDLVAATGGTGVSPRDRTPEAVQDVIEIEIPGFAEKMRADTGKDFAKAYLSRGLAGVRGKTLIVALPGSPKGAVDCFNAIAELIPHVFAMLRGEKH
jgi:molybdenum cofactor synthesis domain-containing protein